MHPQVHGHLSGVGPEPQDLTHLTDEVLLVLLALKRGGGKLEKERRQRAPCLGPVTGVGGGQ